MVLATYQFSYNGVTFGAGTKYRVNLIDGLRSLPQLRTSDYARLRHHGAFSGIDVLEGRHVTATLHVVGSTVTAMDTLLSAFEAATVPLLTGAFPLSYQLPNQTARRVNARVRKRDAPINPTYNLGWQKVDIEWFCSDPRLYDDTLNTTIIAGTTTLNNAGDFESRPVVTVTPSSTTCGIVNAADGSSLVLQPSTLGAVPTPCIVDLLNRTIVDGGGANRMDVLAPQSTWPALQPGNNAITVSGCSTSWAWRAAWV